MADEGGISDYSILKQTAPRMSGGMGGFATLGAALGGGNEVTGQNAYDRGMQVGASTQDALAQARTRVQENAGRESLASQLESNPDAQKALQISPEEGNAYGAAARGGAPFESIINSIKASQATKLAGTIADPNGDLAARHAAAYALAPASMASHAEGTLGTSFDPGANGGSGQVTVGAPQMALNNSEIAQHQASAAADTSNAASHAQSVDQAGSGKLKTGFKWDTINDPNDPNFGQVKTDAQGNPVQTPNSSAGGEGAVQSRYTQRVVNSTIGLSKETGNLAKIGLQTSTEGQVGPGHSGSILGTLKDNLGKGLSSDDAQNYQSSLANIDRQLGIMELAGGVPPGTYTDQLKSATTNTPGNSASARLYHAAVIRQIAEQTAEATQAGQASPERKQAIFDAVHKIQDNIPFTPDEVVDFQREGKTGQTFEQFLGTQSNRPAAESFGTRRVTPAAPAAAPVSTPGGLPAGLKLVN